jgi:serine phosphatase RsbU (regulator of sigma subunit)
VLCVFTDGITETKGYSEQEFGEARLLETLRNNRELEAVQILRNLEDAAEQFRSGEQEEDLTLVIARVR